MTTRVFLAAGAVICVLAMIYGFRAPGSWRTVPGRARNAACRLADWLTLPPRPSHNHPAARAMRSRRIVLTTEEADARFWAFVLAERARYLEERSRDQ